ncbi:MAG TPA: aromatic ring-hydroxylating dioxygenase subunit alpha [Kofleriaceae bacterium]|nr:aromatic ring-hydroxylating dioxygenase subunit alpha [Kofleriaceae bacterium]
MNPDLQRQLVRRVLGHLEHRTTDTAAGPSTVPVTAYLDPAGHERERSALFRDLPVVVAHGSQLPSPGDFVTHDASGVPLLVVRGDDGAVTAFLNVCRHRGMRLEAASCGTRKLFACPYHAWSYARDGHLHAIPHGDGFAGIDLDDRGLVRVPAAEVAGLVFVQPAARGQASLDAELASWLGPVASDLDGFGLPAAQVHAPVTMIKKLSWKLAIEVFLESYHLRAAHLVDPIGPHQRNVFPRRTIRELATSPEADWELRRHASILFHVFPNTLVLVEPEHAAVLHVWPQGPARTQVIAYTLVPTLPATEEQRIYWEASNGLLYGAIEEDLGRGEAIQLGLASGANRDLVLGAFEHAIAHFHDQVAHLVGARREPAAPHALDHAPTGPQLASHSGPHVAARVAPTARPVELRLSREPGQRGGSTSRSTS